MTAFSKVSISPELIVSFLKKTISFKEICQKILYQKIIEQKAQEKNITVTPEEIQAEADRFRLNQRLEKASDTFAWLEEQMISADDWEAGIKEDILAKKLAEHLFTEEAEKYFIQNKLDFEQVLLYQIIVPYERLAQELLYQIEEEEISFYEAAHFYDIDETRRQKCGYEGKLYRWSLIPDISAVVFGAELGEVVGPVKTDAGYHLLKVERFIAAEFTLENRQEIINKLFQKWLEGELNYLLYHSSS
ncbi:peptidylprolyl isomerase [Pleurocapsales cyanobacterium LEGE 06147]|nr:peptidylprolyl isomerase [Pleurocapsales cyanobacterium LEGE 06147]